MHPFSALTIPDLESLLYKVQAASLELPSRNKYLTSNEQFINWLQQHKQPLSSHTATLWATSMATTHAPSTIDQKLSHLQFMAEIGIYPQIRSKAQRKLIQGLDHIRPLQLHIYLLWPTK